MDRTEWIAGRHSVKFEAPDLFHVHIKAGVNVSEAKETYELMGMVASEIGRKVILVVHLEGSGSFSKETREYYATMQPLWKALVVLGGSTVMRAMVSVIVKAMQLLAKDGFPPTKMVKHLDEALPFILDIRKSEVQARPPSA